MADPTALDLLCARVPFHDADAPLRALVLRQLADTELHAALVTEPAGDRAELRMFDLPGGPVALAFDDAAALAGFLGGPVAHVSLPGRVLARELAEAGRGLLVNPGRPSEMLLDGAALDWLCTALAARPETGEAAPRRLTAPRADVLAVLAEPLAARLADMAGMVAGIALVGTAGQTGEGGHLIVVAGAADQDHAVIAKALAELIAFLPEIEGGVDVTFQPLALPPGAVRIEPMAPEPQPTAPSAGQGAPPRLRW
ncbi:SseB family protein [Paracoccus contaminans]|uniref:SseB protein N-terminal domain-containing protein n=1 Tax=Paracoccus contaminans TaxID=1945662 RepID=A0A1W6D0G0_9RHOB|nr:SseB family protein [Paracoccus contaminans]ARJ70611.1 hypothetical protein B0A89_00915 [Paracoccus contaminans]